MKTTRSQRLALSLVFLLSCSLWGARILLPQMSGYHGLPLRDNDADANYFVSAWDETPHFSDTLKWWHGPWGQHFRPFYRPLSSLFFWTQYHLFGPNGKFEFTAMLLLWHLATVLVVWRFLWVLLGELPATLSVGVWAAGILSFFEMPTPCGALLAWKDIVECWFSIPYVVCLWCFLRFLRGEPPRYKWLALLWFWIALLFKEMAYTVPFMLLLLSWHEGKLRERWRDALPFFAVAAVMVLFRFWALQGLGFRMGSNQSWLVRFVADIGGGPLMRLFNRDFFSLAMLCGFAVPWQVLERRWWRAGASLAAGCLLVALTALFSDLTFGEVTSRSIVEQEWPAVLYLAALLFLWWRCLQRRNKHQIFGALWAIITYLPLLSGSNTPHIHYFVSIGWAIWLTYGLLDIAEQLHRALSRQLKPPINLQTT